MATKTAMVDAIAIFFVFTFFRFLLEAFPI